MVCVSLTILGKKKKKTRRQGDMKWFTQITHYGIESALNYLKANETYTCLSI